MALTEIVPNEKKKKRTPLENAATALGLVGSAASIGQTLGGMSGSKEKIPDDMAMRYSRFRLKGLA